jgi:hypothetical protein
MLPLTHSHVLAVFFAATDTERADGARWYSDALQICSTIARDCSLSVQTVAGVLAALSPNNRWERNCTDARALCTAYAMGTVADAAAVKCSTFNGNKRKALQILAGEQPLAVLGGLKVRAFYQCVLGDDAVCVDGHAFAIWRGERIPTTKTPKISAKLYASIEADYRRATVQINAITGASYSPAQIQAITWCAWRRIVREA